MEIADVMIRLGGDKSNEIFKRDVTPAEVLVLRVLHGPQSVFDIKQKSLTEEGKSPEKRSHRAELQRLRRNYHGNPGNNTDLTGRFIDQGSASETGGVVDKLFPGLNPTLPIKFDDIIERVEDEEDLDETPEKDEIEEELQPAKSKRRPSLREVEPVAA